MRRRREGGREGGKEVGRERGTGRFSGTTDGRLRRKRRNHARPLLSAPDTGEQNTPGRTGRVRGPEGRRVEDREWVHVPQEESRSFHPSPI